ncbi:MAG: hypothetical protein RML95_11615 [Anaerolineae bacterium]|nr:hypothetical protein [Anaerolineae bacterium]
MSSNFPIVYGDYAIESMLGAGAFGVVYKAQHREFGTVALKFLWAASQSPDRLTYHLREPMSALPQPEPESLKAFDQEIALMMALERHTLQDIPEPERGLYTPRFCEQGEWHSVKFLAMEFVESSRYRSAETLRRQPPSHMPDWEREVIWIVTRYLYLVSYLHQNGMFLQDSQLQNIRYNVNFTDVKKDCLRILDWNGTRTFEEGRRLYGYLQPHSHDLWMACAFAFAMLSGVTLERTQHLSARKLDELGGERWRAVSAGRREVISQVLSVPIGNLPASFTATELIKYLNKPEQMPRQVRDADHDRIIRLIDQLASADEEELGRALGAAHRSDSMLKEAYDASLSLDQLRYRILLAQMYRNRGDNLAEMAELEAAAREWLTVFRNLSEDLSPDDVERFERNLPRHPAFEVLREDFLREARLYALRADLPKRLDGSGHYDLTTTHENNFRKLLGIAKEHWRHETYRQKVIEHLLGEEGLSGLGRQADEAPERRLEKTFKRLQERIQTLDEYQKTLERELANLKNAPSNVRSALNDLADQCVKRDPAHPALIEHLRQVYNEWRSASRAETTEYCIRLAENIGRLRLALDAELVGRHQSFFEQLRSAISLRDMTRQFTEQLTSSTASEEQLDQSWQALLEQFSDGADRAYIIAQVLGQLEKVEQVSVAAYRFCKQTLRENLPESSRQTLDKSLEDLHKRKRKEAQQAVLSDGKSPEKIEKIVESVRSYDVDRVLSKDDQALLAELKAFYRDENGFQVFEEHYQNYKKLIEPNEGDRSKPHEIRAHIRAFQQKMSLLQERFNQLIARFTFEKERSLEIPLLRDVDKVLRDAQSDIGRWQAEIKAVEKRQRNLIAFVSTAAAVIFAATAIVASLASAANQQRAVEETRIAQQTAIERERKAQQFAAEQTATAVVLNPSLTAAALALDAQFTATAQALNAQATETALAQAERIANLTATGDARTQIAQKTIIALSATPTPTPTLTPTFTPTDTPTPTPSSTPTDTPTPTFTPTATPTPTIVPISSAGLDRLSVAFEASVSGRKTTFQVFRVPQIEYGDRRTLQLTPTSEQGLEFIGLKDDVVWLEVAQPVQNVTLAIYRLDNREPAGRVGEPFFLDAQGAQKFTVPEDGRYQLVLKSEGFAGELTFTLHADVRFFDFGTEQKTTLDAQNPVQRYRFFASKGDEIKIAFESLSPEFERLSIRLAEQTGEPVEARTPTPVPLDLSRESSTSAILESTILSTGYHTFVLNAAEHFRQFPQSAPIEVSFKAELHKHQARSYLTNSNFSFRTLPEDLRWINGTQVAPSVSFLVSTLQTASDQPKVALLNVVETNNDNFQGYNSWHLLRDKQTLRLRGWAKVIEVTLDPSSPTRTPTPMPPLVPVTPRSP